MAMAPRVKINRGCNMGTVGHPALRADSLASPHVPAPTPHQTTPLRERDHCDSDCPCDATTDATATTGSALCARLTAQRTQWHELTVAMRDNSLPYGFNDRAEGVWTTTPGPRVHHRDQHIHQIHSVRAPRGAAHMVVDVMRQHALEGGWQAGYERAVRWVEQTQDE